jgi:DNA-binding transcriptional ArsR family regulator
MSPRSTPSAAPRDRASSLDAVFFALADGTRRALLARLRTGSETAGSLATGFAVTRPAVSRHLRVLRHAALVTEQRRGRERVYAIVPERLGLVRDWLDEYRVFWPARLHDLKALVESLPDEPAPRAPARRPRPRRSR